MLCAVVAMSVRCWLLASIVNFTVPAGAETPVRLLPAAADDLPPSAAADTKSTVDRFILKAGRTAYSSAVTLPLYRTPAAEHRPQL